MVQRHTNIATVQWNLIKESSSDSTKFYRNFTDNSIIATSISERGVEYYLCSEQQLSFKQLGEYLGCTKHPMMEDNHEIGNEKFIALDNEVFLSDLI